MKCIVCDNKLSPVKAGDVTLDVCIGGCGGIWFDNFELTKFDEPHEYAAGLLAKVPRKAGLEIDHTRKRKCPKCDDIIMMRHFFSALRRVEVDECPNCGGYWLDAGELALIREEHQSELEREMAVKKYLSEAASSQIRAARPAGPEQAERARIIVKILQFAHPIRRDQPRAG
jgi:Zn-finger nucleic acid-binding protein